VSNPKKQDRRTSPYRQRKPAPFRRWSVAYELSVPIQLLCGDDVVLVLRAVAGQNPLAEEIASALNRARVVLPKEKP